MQTFAVKIKFLSHSSAGLVYVSLFHIFAALKRKTESMVLYFNCYINVRVVCDNAWSMKHFSMVFFPVSSCLSLCEPIFCRQFTELPSPLEWLSTLAGCISSFFFLLHDTAKRRKICDFELPTLLVEFFRRNVIDTRTKSGKH